MIDSEHRECGVAGPLRVITGALDRHVGDDELPRLRAEQTTRPGERHEQLKLDRPIVADVQIAAEALRLPVDACVRLLIERRLAVEAVTEALKGTVSEEVVALIGEIDTVAASARAHSELSPASSAYAQTLLFGMPHTTGAFSVPVVKHVAVPMRLLDRVDAHLIERALARGDVEAARDWEIAAVIDGMSLGEWAALAALRLAARS